MLFALLYRAGRGGRDIKLMRIVIIIPTDASSKIVLVIIGSSWAKVWYENRGFKNRGSHATACKVIDDVAHEKWLSNNLPS
jgi:hypothetical protein